MRHLPNFLSLLRILLGPWCAWAILHNDYRTALGLFLIAGVTDFLDGFLAKRLGWGSAAGAYIDPLADKALMVMVYAALGVAGAVPLWLVGLVFGRDLMILGGVALMYARRGRKQFPPTMAGKVSTVLQIGAALAVMSVENAIVPEGVRWVAIGAVAVGTAYSGLDYIRIGWRMLHAPR